MIIELTDEDIAEATRCGKSRQSHNEASIRDQKVCDRGSNEINVNGAKAELAVVKATGYEWNCFTPHFWETPRHKRLPDVGPIEVRTNNRRFRVNMLLYQKNGNDMSPYLLVIPLSDRRYELAGWRFGFECRKNEFWQLKWKRPCYAVPDHSLYSLKSLRNWCESKGCKEWKQKT